MKHIELSTGEFRIYTQPPYHDEVGELMTEIHIPEDMDLAMLRMHQNRVYDDVIHYLSDRHSIRIDKLVKGILGQTINIPSGALAGYPYNEL